MLLVYIAGMLRSTAMTGSAGIGLSVHAMMEKESPLIDA